MKATKENITALENMGFINEDNDPTGWWRTPDGWAFCMKNVPSIKALTKRLIRYYYTAGYIDGKDGAERMYDYIAENM